MPEALAGFLAIECSELSVMVLMCVGAQLPFLVSSYLLEREGYGFRPGNMDDHWYAYVLMYKYADPVDEVNAFLREQGAGGDAAVLIENCLKIACGCLRLRAIFLRNFCFFGEKIDTRCGWGRLAWWRGVGVFGVGRGDFMGADFVGFLAVGVAVKCGWPGGRGAAILGASKLRMIL